MLEPAVQGEEVKCRRVVPRSVFDTSVLPRRDILTQRGDPSEPLFVLSCQPDKCV